MKDVADTTAIVIDYGTFIGLAERLAKSFKKQYYYSPFEQEYHGIKTACIGDGIAGIERLDDFMEPKVFDEIDLWIFPDIAYGGLQRFLRANGKLVWGSMGASDLELYRTRFLQVLKELELPVVKYQNCVGLSALAEYLKETENKWVKINRYREDMETWHHQDWDHSQRQLETLAIKFGGLKEHPVFIVQDAIDGALELGFDGLTVDGQYPEQAFYGYEKKNELYLGCLMDYAALPESVRLVNEAIAPILAEYQYRNFMATEIRELDGVPHFTDPTFRLAGQTMEHQFRTCKNLPEVILYGAGGELIQPEFEHPYAAEATMHYTAGCADDWKTLKIEDKSWLSLYHYCEADGLCHFPPGKVDEVGVVSGAGDTPEEALDNLKEHFDALGDEPVAINFEEFADLLTDIRKGQEEGIGFGDEKVPSPAVILDEK